MSTPTDNTTSIAGLGMLMASPPADGSVQTHTSANVTSAGAEPAAAFQAASLTGQASPAAVARRSAIVSSPAAQCVAGISRMTTRTLPGDAFSVAIAARWTWCMKSRNCWAVRPSTRVTSISGTSRCYCAAGSGERAAQLPVRVGGAEAFLDVEQRGQLMPDHVRTLPRPPSQAGRRAERSWTGTPPRRGITVHDKQIQVAPPPLVRGWRLV
jgi:hypothetical protein